MSENYSSAASFTLERPSRPRKSLPPMRTNYDCCPLCAGTEMVQAREADCTHHDLYRRELPEKMRWLLCTSCNHVFTDGYWTDEALKLIFTKTHENQQPGFQMEQCRVVGSEMVEKVVAASGKQPAGVWLDVGFGNGYLMFAAKEYGFHPVGLDLRPASVDAMNTIGFEARCQDITEAEFEVPVSVISMADCLEHMPFPMKGLAAAHGLLADGGMLFLSMPNLSAPVWNYLDHHQQNPFWGEIEHYHNFSRERLYEVLADTGFEVVSYGISKRYRCCMEVIAKKTGAA